MSIADKVADSQMMYSVFFDGHCVLLLATIQEVGKVYKSLILHTTKKFDEARDAFLVPVLN